MVVQMKDTLARIGARFHTVSGIMYIRGQRVSARDRLYLAEKVPTLLVFGERDRMIPASHCR